MNVKSAIALGKPKSDWQPYFRQLVQQINTAELLSQVMLVGTSIGQAASMILLHEEQPLVVREHPYVKVALAHAYFVNDATIDLSALLHAVDFNELPSYLAPTYIALVNRTRAEGKPLTSDLVVELSGDRYLVPDKRVNSIKRPIDKEQMQIGVPYELVWESQKLLGDTLNIYINHEFNDDIAYKQWPTIQKTSWKLAMQGVPNTGRYLFEPYYFMANGYDKFKVMLVSNLGYWSLSSGLFSIAAGKALDNGLEHQFIDEFLVDVIEKPIAYDQYKVGIENKIIWKAADLQGERVSIYVLHDSAKGIGDGIHVNSSIVRDRRWYLIAGNIENSGLFSLDPSIFNGRGNNYKLLIISNKGSWAVSDKRFSVMNPF